VYYLFFRAALSDALPLFVLITSESYSGGNLRFAIHRGFGYGVEVILQDSTTVVVEVIATKHLGDYCLLVHVIHQGLGSISIHLSPK
jgi:hypothetical protein